MADEEPGPQVPPGLAQEFADQPWPVVGFATTEHSNLVALRAATVTDANGRSAAYLATLSAALVALGLISGPGFTRAFFAFGVLVLAAPALVGVVTFARCVQSSVEDLRLSARIDRVRDVYVRLLPNLARSFEPPAGEGVDATRRAAGATLPGRWQLFLTLAGLIGTVNSLVLGVLVGFLLELVRAPAAVLLVAGGLVTAVALVLHMEIQARAFR